MIRQELLEAALAGTMRPAEVGTALAGAPWDSQMLVVLRRAHVCDALNRLLAREWSTSEVEQWADLLEGRDDVGLEPGYEVLLKGVLFDLANPDIHGPIDRDVALHILARLAQADEPAR